MTCSDRITPLLDSVLECIEARYVDCDVDWFCRAGVVAGNAVWDDCCECGHGEGQLWLRVIDWLPDPDFALPGITGCAQPSLITVGIGALRCVPVISEDGDAPSTAELAASAAQIHLDAQLIYGGVVCCVPEQLWTGWTPLGSDGGCGGGEHTFQLPLVPCSCVEELGS